MNKLITASLYAAFTLSAANASAVSLGTVGTAVDVVAAGAATNTAQTIELTAIANRAGFVKNTFDITLSANTALSVVDNATSFGVSAGSNRGRGVYTGHSDGGSVTQCGDLVDDSVTNKAASAVATRLAIANANACSVTTGGTTGGTTSTGG